MKVHSNGDTLSVLEVKQLGASGANAIRDEIRAAFSKLHKNIEFDLSTTDFLDSCGLGCLVALHKTAVAHGGCLRIVNPRPQALQLLQLTRLDRVFEVAKA